MASTDLTTLSDLKAFISPNPSDTSMDALLSSLITSASTFIARYCNRNFIVASFTEVRDGNSRCTLLLKNYPVTAVSAVSINGITIVAAPDQVSSGFIAPDPTENSGLLRLRGYEFCKGYQNVTVTYTAGLFAATANASVSEVGQACRELVNAKYQKRTRPDQLSHSLGGAIVAAFSAKDMPPEVQTLLCQYINPAIPLG